MVWGGGSMNEGTVVCIGGILVGCVDIRVGGVGGFGGGFLF
jgi:hypothetical protein